MASARGRAGLGFAVAFLNVKTTFDISDCQDFRQSACQNRDSSRQFGPYGDTIQLIQFFTGMTDPAPYIALIDANFEQIFAGEQYSTGPTNAPVLTPIPGFPYSSNYLAPWSLFTYDFTKNPGFDIRKGTYQVAGFNVPQTSISQFTVTSPNSVALYMARYYIKELPVGSVATLWNQPKPYQPAVKVGTVTSTPVTSGSNGRPAVGSLFTVPMPPSLGFGPTGLVLDNFNFLTYP